MTRSEEDYLSTNEVNAKLSCLLKADLLRLRRIAELQAHKLRDCDPDDLLAEGLDRVISGVRRWPRGVETATFMRMVFGSIVSSKAKHAVLVSQHEVTVEVDPSGNPDAGDFTTEAGTNSDPADEVYAHEMLEKVASKLANDPHAQALALALGEGLTASETQSQFHMSQNQYDSARKRLRRVVSRLIAEENAP
ncbi:hypothetical protein [Alcanivorax sp. 24]|uniref:hypothetical protein n=1 Tax=Alcanivorax sp. 24 TaxID=2545266 RepID=UPI0010602F3C|nr:hypothetical protein [Alcanivorax sp. 24]